MSKIKLPKEELNQHLQEQLWLLIESCNHFDRGKQLEAKRISVTLRILLHDTNAQDHY